MRPHPVWALTVSFAALNCICTAAISPRAVAAAPAFYNIGAFPGQNFPSSALDGISPDGSLAVGRSNSIPPTTLGARWSIATGLQALGNESGFIYTTARDASLNGTYIAGYHQLPSTFQYKAFRLGPTGSIDLGDLPGGTGDTLADGISRDGQTVVGLGNFNFGLSGDQGFVWTPATGIRGIGFLPGGNISQAVAVSGDGKVIVGDSNNASGVSLAFRSTPQGLVPLGDLPGGTEDGIASGVNFDGSVIVGRSNSANGYEGFRWTAARGMEPLGDLPGGEFRSTPLDLTDDGSTIVGYAETGIGVGVGEEAFIWDEAHGMRNLKEVLQSQYGLDLSAWTLSRANAISADGSVIVGDGVINGQRRGWVATVPEPTLLAATCIALTILAQRRRLVIGRRPVPGTML
jgi:probable HAF family extracellular repeat protein